MRKNSWRVGSKWARVKRIVLKRQKVCQCCGDVDRLEVHHIEDASYHPKKRYVLYNLIVLCHTCHFNMFHILFKGGTRKKTNKEDFYRFMSISKHYLNKK